MPTQTAYCTIHGSMPAPDCPECQSQEGFHLEPPRAAAPAKAPTAARKRPSSSRKAPPRKPAAEKAKEETPAASQPDVSGNIPGEEGVRFSSTSGKLPTFNEPANK